MPLVDKYQPGTFCWVDVVTSDTEAGKKFHTGLFGWEFQDTPVGDESFYTMFIKDGQTVCALTPLQEAQAAMGVPPHWNSYVSVASADDSATKAQSLGGNLLMPAFDVMEVGRMAVVQGSTGAILAVWEAKEHIGAGVVN